MAMRERTIMEDGYEPIEEMEVTARRRPRRAVQMPVNMPSYEPEIPKFATNQRVSFDEPGRIQASREEKQSVAMMEFEKNMAMLEMLEARDPRLAEWFRERMGLVRRKSGTIASG